MSELHTAPELDLSTHVPRFLTYRAVVQRVRAIGPNFVRVTLGGRELQAYQTSGIAPKVKIFVPHDTKDEPEVPKFGPSGFAYADGVRTPVVRTYTVRAHRLAAGEIDIDFVVHQDGPAGRWAAGARAGDRVVITNASGSSFPDDLSTLLFVGDPSSLAAIMTVVETLDSATSFAVLLLAERATDIIPIEPPAAGHTRWIIASDTTDPSSELVDRILELVVGHDIDYVWVAGEANTLRHVRRALRDEAGYTKENSRVVGYWRRSSTADEYDRQTLDRMRSALLTCHDPNAQDLDELSIPDDTTTERVR